MCSLCCRFADTADSVRLRLAQTVPPPRVLEGRLVTVHCMPGSGAASAKAAEHRNGLQRLIVVLGGRVSRRGKVVRGVYVLRLAACIMMWFVIGPECGCATTGDWSAAPHFSPFSHSGHSGILPNTDFCMM